jgi:hypothetical protein
VKSIRTSLLVLSIAAVVALVILGAQLQIPTAFAFPKARMSKVFAFPSLTSQNPVPLGSNTCIGSGCHTNSGSPGGAAITGFPAGMAYTSGTPIPLTVTVNDATRSTWGFELTARLASNTSSAAGTFTPGSNSNLGTNGVQVIQGTSGSSPSFSFVWNPPATASGAVNFYLTALATNSTGNNGAYTASYVLSPAAATPDFSLGGSATSLTTTQGSTSGADTITVTPKNGFTGNVTLSTSTLPSGVSGTFSTNPATTTSSLTFTASSAAATGTSTLTITGTSGSLTHTTTVSLTVNAAPDFSLSASPNSVSITQGGTGAGTVTVAPQNGFTGSVSLSASGLPSGVTASFSPTSATTTSALTLAASSSATTGTAAVTITGTSGGLTHTTTISLTVNAASVPNFGLSASPSSVTFMQGSSGTSTVTVTPQNGFSSSVSLSASGLPSGVTASFSPASATTTSTLTLSASSSAATGPTTVTITGTSGSLSHTTTVNLTINAAPVPDFSLSASPGSMMFMQGASGTSTVTVTPQNGFSSSVSLSASGLPSGVTASFSPTSATSTSTLTLTASSSAATGPTTVTITGTSGSLSHTTTVSLTVSAAPVPSFGLSASPGSVSIAGGASGTSIVTVTPQNGFKGSVSLSASGLPSGVTASFSPSSATTTTTLTLTVGSTAAPGTSTITITGTSGASSATASVGLVVTATPSVLAASPASVSFNYRLGTAVPAAQNIQVTASTTALAYTTSVSDPTWLSATPPSATTPGTVVIGIIPGALQPGSYSGAVTISSIGALGSPQTIQVALTVTTEQLNSTTTRSAYPNLVIDRAGNFNVAWIDGSAGLLFSRSTFQGPLFSSPLVIPGSTGAAFQPQVVVDSTGNDVYLAWAAAGTITTGSYDVYESQSTNGGVSFLATPTKLTLSPIPLADGPRMAVDSTGIVSVVWGRDEADITQSSNGGGTFFAPIKISTVAQNSGGPRVAVDSKGTVYVVWTDEANKTAFGSYCSSPASTGTGINGLPIYSNTSGGTVYVNITAPRTTPTATPSTVGAVTYGTRDLSATDWKGTSANWPNGFFGCSYDNLQILVDSGDNVHIVWADDLPDESVFASAYPLVVGSPGADLFSFPSIVTSQPSASPYATIDSTNNVDLVWSGGPGGSAATAGVFFSRSTDNVAPFGRTFTPPANVVSNSESPEFPQVAIDASGNVDVVWQQNSTTTPGAFDVYFARSFDNGAGFSVTASPVSATPSMQCLSSSSVTTSQIPPPPFTTCGSVALGVDSGSTSDLIWIGRPSGQTISNVLFDRVTITSASNPAPDFYMALAAPTQTGSPTAPASYSLTLSALYGFASSVTLTCSGLPAGASCAAIPAVTPATTGTAVVVSVGVTSSLAPGTYNFSITGASAVATHTVQASLVIAGALTPDFSIAVLTTSQSALAGTTANYSTSVASVGGYGSIVSLTCPGLPTGATCAALSVKPTAAGASATLVVTVSASVAAGTYSFSITGASGTLIHSGTATLVVTSPASADFTMAVPANSALVLQGSAASYAVNIAALNGFNGVVTLTCSGLPTGAACSASPATVTGQGSATISFTVPATVAAGTYPFTLIATAGSLSHSQLVTLSVGSVSGSVIPSTTASIAVGGTSKFTVLVSSSNGAGGTVNLSCGGVVTGITCSFSPSSINLTGAIAQSTLTVSVTSMPAAVPGGAPNSRMRTGPGEIALRTAYPVLFLMVLVGIATSTREGRRSARLSCGLAVFAIVLISVTMVSCGLVGTTPSPQSTSATGGGSVTSHITLQAQSGTVTTTLTTLSITVP